MSLSLFLTVADTLAPTGPVRRPQLTSAISLSRVSLATPSTDTVTISNAALSQSRNSSLQKLSEATSFVNIAESATEKVSSLVNQVYEIAEQLETALAPDIRSALASEAESLLEEINSISEEATLYDTESVVDAGTQTFTINLNSADSTSSSTRTVTVLDVPISRESLGLDELDASSLSSDPSGALETLRSAQLTLSQTELNLEASKNEITAIATQFRETQAVRLDSRNLESTANDLATQISAAISENLSSAANNLNPISVQELLEPVNSTTSNSEEESS